MSNWERGGRETEDSTGKKGERRKGLKEGEKEREKM